MLNSDSRAVCHRWILTPFSTVQVDMDYSWSSHNVRDSRDEGGNLEGMQEKMFCERGWGRGVKSPDPEELLGNVSTTSESA